MYVRLIKKDSPALEGEYTKEELYELNRQGYNVYYFPNHPRDYPDSGHINSSYIDVFGWVFVDCDIKDEKYANKDEFIEAVAISGIRPTRIVDSGHGIHVYWRVSDLDVNSYLRFQRRLCRLYNTDEAVAKICQLMRLPGYDNVKDMDHPIACQVLYEEDVEYTSEDLDKLLPVITKEDEAYCQQHYRSAYALDSDFVINEAIPPKFGKLLKSNSEAKNLWSQIRSDRSKDDFRLANIMLANDFSKDEAMSVLVNTAKALQRSPIHRRSYAKNIADKLWTYNEDGELYMADTVRDILMRPEEELKGVRFPCHKIVDDTVHGFRLGQVLGIIGGSGVGKTTLTLNCFLWFAAANPEYHHFFFSLEQPPGEIAQRIKTICGENTMLFDKIHIVSNYELDGTYKGVSMATVQEYLLKFKQKTGFKVGAAVVDHIGVLERNDSHGEFEGLQSICKKMKTTAVAVNCMLIMLSQAPREKAGIGDLELNKDAAFGTSYFENFVDYLICLWQPLKRVYKDGAPTIMAFKFAKIRHKKQGQDVIQEDVRYQLFFDPQTERLRELTQKEEEAARFHINVATHDRAKDRKTEVLSYESRRVESTDESKANSH